MEDSGDVNELNSGIRMVYKRVYFYYCFILKIVFENVLLIMAVSSSLIKGNSI